ncbi:MAG: thiamine phosphate synthase [Acidobacteria bacterium]|nr:thiamine phosphate synthase [Acidobacteriota bacterium]
MKPELSTPIVYCISEGDITTANFFQKKSEIIRKVQRAAGLGVNFFQVREKNLAAGLLFDLVTAAVEASRDRPTKILVNGRLDIAFASGAHGVHLPSDGIPIGRVRQTVGEELIIGVSAHSLAEVEKAKAEGADFAAFAPVFASPGKSGAQGVEKLRDVCAAVAPFPVVALGGIDKSNVDEVFAAGASGYAAIRYLNELLRSKSGSEF